MPQSKYGALSVCRQNLVPVCYDCNNKKLDKDFSGFVHCYYEKYPTDKPFFNFDFSVSNSVLVPEISITHVSEELKNKIKNQIDKLNLKMRWQRSINSFLYQILSTNIENQKMLEDNLKALNETYEKTFHKNDWRTAVIRGLINCEDFTYEVAKIYIDNPNPINDGGV